MFGRHSITNLSQNIFILANNLIPLTSHFPPIYSFFSDYSTLFLTILSSLYLQTIRTSTMLTHFFSNLIFPDFPSSQSTLFFTYSSAI